MGERYELHEPDYDDYEVSEFRENESDDIQDRAETRKYISLGWDGFVPENWQIRRSLEV